MNLKSGSLYWPAVDAAPPTFAPLDKDVRADVAVIGSGVSGAMVADELSGRGLEVVVLDRRRVCSGSTPASTGLLQYEIDTPLVKLIELVGRDHATRAYRASHTSLAQFRELVSGLDDDCALIDRSSLYLSCEADDYAELSAEHEARRELGIQVELMDAGELHRRFNVSRPGGALWSASAMEVDPVRLTLALIRRAVSRGVRVYPETEVSNYDPTDAGVMLTATKGNFVHAKHVIFATGYETPEFLDPTICSLKSTYAFASEPVEAEALAAWRDHCLIWESGDPYFYARTTRDGRVIVGGEDDDFSDPTLRDSRIVGKCATLVEKFKRLFPQIDLKPQFRWAGTFATTKDGLPFTGRHEKFPRGLFALGYGGNGITFSLIASQILADLVTGKQNPDAELFRFDR